MRIVKKIFNVFGIILAWILSIVLVVVLFVSPVTLSAMSVATPKNLVQILQSVEPAQLIEIAGEHGADSESEEIKALLSTNTVQELYDIYLTNVLSVVDSSVVPEELTEEKLQEIAHRNIDEFYQLALEQMPDLGDLPEQEAKDQLEVEVVDLLTELADFLPTAEELREMLTQEPTVKAALDALNQMNTIKLIFVGVIAALALLLFICRLPGFRGFRWLAVDLFVATGLGGGICAGLFFGMSMVQSIAAENPMVGLLVETLLSAFSRGVYIRTGIMLAIGIVFLVIYSLIKKARDKKAQTAIQQA